MEIEQAARAAEFRPVRILWVKAGKLLPLDSGGKLRTYHILRHLSKAHALTYLSYYSGPRDERYERDIVEQLPGTVTVHTGGPGESALQRGLHYLRHVTSRAPYAVVKFTDSKVQRLVADWLGEGRFDVAVCDFLSSSLNFPRELATPSVLFQHNVEGILWRRKAELEARWVDRMVSRLESAKMQVCEPAQVKRFHHVISVSEQDREAMAAMTDASRLSVVPTGVDLDTYSYDPGARPSWPIVVFTGSMDWEPNIDGVEFFCSAIWPRVLAEVPEARFQIVGRHPPARVKRLASESVEVTGTVPSVLGFLRGAAVFVVPLRIGGGTRIKLYEGMAMGKATVSTTVGAEGLEVRSGRDLILADDPAAFAEAVIRFLREDDTRRRFEAAAAAHAQQYDWSVVTERFAGILEETVALARQREPVKSGGGGGEPHERARTT